MKKLGRKNQAAFCSLHWVTELTCAASMGTASAEQGQLRESKRKKDMHFVERVASFDRVSSKAHSAVAITKLSFSFFFKNKPYTFLFFYETSFKNKILFIYF